MTLTKNKRGDIIATILTNHGNRRLNTRCCNRADADKVIAQAKLKELELTARGCKLTAEVVSVILSDTKRTLDELAEQWSAYYRTTCSERSAREAIATVKQFIADQRLGRKTPHEITLDVLDGWLNRDAGLKAASRKVYLSRLKTFMHWLHAEGCTIKQPQLLVKIDFNKLSHAQKERKKIPAMAKEDYWKILNHIKSEMMLTYAELLNPRFVGRKIVQLQRKHDRFVFWLCATIISRETGLRLGDVCQLEWDCFDAASDTITVWTDKRNKRVGPLPITEEMNEAIGYLQKIDNKYLFKREREVILGRGRGALSTEFIRLCLKAGVEGGFHFHCLRHDHVRARHAAGESLKAIGRDVAHSSEKTTEAYL